MGRCRKSLDRWRDTSFCKLLNSPFVPHEEVCGRNRDNRALPRNMQSNNQNPPNPITMVGTRAQSFMRQNTNDSTQSAQSQMPRRSDSFQIKARREREAAKPKRYQEKYPVYAGLTWDALWGYLHQKWPKEEFKEERVSNKV